MIQCHLRIPGRADDMTALEIIPFILFLVVIGTAIAERINVPYPLVLVVAGLIAGFIPGIPNWHPPSNLILVLFLPPILFAAARLISWHDIKYNIVEIFSLSIVLVIISAFILAYVLHYFVPGMPIRHGLVLGAIIAPTDAIAASSILNKLNSNQRLVKTLEIESMFNDAIAIVLYNAAVLYVFLGTWSFANNITDTLFMGIGGVLTGLVFSWFSSIIVKEFLTDSENELPIIMGLILAYIAYLFAERIHTSGVLAVVAAGLFHRRTERIIKARTRLSERSVWDTYIFFLNGLIFIVIGLQFPIYYQKVSFIPTQELILFSAITICITLVLRAIWVALTEYFSRLLHRLRKNPPTPYTWRELMISSWAGMRGMISLALAIALPVQVTKDIPFSYRDLIIFLTIITILFTLVIQGLTLAPLTKWLRVKKEYRLLLKQTNHIYQRLTKHAFDEIKSIKEKNETSDTAYEVVNNYYYNRLYYFKLSEKIQTDIHIISKDAEKLLSKMLTYERDLLNKMLTKGEISEEVYMRIRHKIDRDEVGFATYK